MGDFDLQSFLWFGIAITILMAGNAASGVMKARKEGTFSYKDLRDGCVNYALWLVTVLCLVAATELYGGDFTITIDGTSYSLFQAVDLAKRTVYIFWVGKLIQNVYEYAGISKQVRLEKMMEAKYLEGDYVLPEEDILPETAEEEEESPQVEELPEGGVNG